MPSDRLTYEESEEISDKVHELIAGKIEGERILYFSVGNKCRDPLSIAVAGAVKFVASTDEFWSGNGDKYSDYESAIVHNPTWVDVAALADAMIKTTGDFHHQFLEDVAKKSQLAVADELNPTGVSVYEFHMGS